MQSSPFGLQARRDTSSPHHELRAALRKFLPANASGEIAVRLAGEIQVAGSLCDVVALLAQAGRSGTLIVTSAEATRTIAIDRGELVGASTTVPSERLGEVLYRSGEISRDDIDEVLLMSALEGRLFGQMLVTMGHVDPVVLESLLTRQAEEIFYAAVRVDNGVFCFVDEGIGVPITAFGRPSLLSMLMEGARRMDEMLVYRELVGSSRHIPKRVGGGRELGGELPAELASICDLCDGERSVAEIGREIGMLEFEVTQGIHALATQGLVEVTGPRVRTTHDLVALYNDVLIEVHRRCDRQRTGESLRTALDRYVSTRPDLAALLHDVAPDDDGSLDPVKIVRNAATSTRRDALVRHLIGEYVDFAVFQAGSLLPSSAATELPGFTMRLLQPILEAPPLSSTRLRSEIAPRLDDEETPVAETTRRAFARSGL